MQKRKVIIDCDPGIDDSLAILLAINSPELEVLGLTITSGNVPAQLGAKNALKALQMCQRLDIPVYIGEELPLERELVTAQDTHGVLCSITYQVSTLSGLVYTLTIRTVS